MPPESFLPGSMLCGRVASALFVFRYHFWRCVPIATVNYQINDDIRDPEVRVIGEDGAQLGIMSSEEALQIAEEKDLDLVKIAPGSNPPVCKIMDYGKFRYEQGKKAKQNRRNAAATRVKEVQFHPSVGDADYAVKLRKLKDFLSEGSRVKVALFFRGRENAHKELGFDLMNRVLADSSDIGVVEQAPKLLGRNIQMTLMPKPKARQGGAPKPAAPAP